MNHFIESGEQHASSPTMFWNFFVSFILWIPLVGLLVWLVIEHYMQNRLSQLLIVLFITFGAILRWIWYLFLLLLMSDRSRNIIQQTTVGIISRLAILLQFTAFSLLILLWIRILNFSSLADRHIAQDDLITSSNKSALLGRQDNDYNKLYYWMTIIINLVVWITIISTFLISNLVTVWYDANMIIIVVLCFCQALLISTVGLSIGIKLKRQYDETSALPNFSRGKESIATANSTAVESSQIIDQQSDSEIDHKIAMNNKHRAIVPAGEGGKPLLNMCCALICPHKFMELYEFIYSRHHKKCSRASRLQRKVLRSLLTVSTVSCVCFLIRGLAFILTPTTAHVNSVQTYSYPWLLYEVPELIPALFIGYGVSPPQGVLRRLAAVRWGGLLQKSLWWCLCCMCVCLDTDKSGGGSSNASYVAKSSFGADMLLTSGSGSSGSVVSSSASSVHTTARPNISSPIALSHPNNHHHHHLRDSSSANNSALSRPDAVMCSGRNSLLADCSEAVATTRQSITYSQTAHTQIPTSFIDNDMSAKREGTLWDPSYTLPKGGPTPGVTSAEDELLDTEILYTMRLPDTMSSGFSAGELHDV